MKLRKSVVVLSVALAMAPLQASAAAAVIAATAATGAAASAASSSNNAQQLPQGISGPPIEWAEVGWLRCPSHYAKPDGCRETIERDWRPDVPGEVEPWIDWMKRHKGADARFMGMTVVEGDVRLFYGVPASSKGAR